MNDNKHKVAFYIVLVFLLFTLRHCHGSREDITEVYSHSARALPKNTIEITSLESLNRSYAMKSVSEKLIEIRGLLRSLLFDWSLDGESVIAGRTFGRLRQIKQLLVPAAFLGGFLTAVIMGIKIIGVINMLLITGVLVLNLAVILGKLFFAKLDKFSHHGHYGHHGHYDHHGHGPPPYYAASSNSYAYADNRADSSLPYRRNFNSSPFFNFNQQEFGQGFSPFNQALQGQNNQVQSAFLSNFNQPSIIPPTNFQPQPQSNSPFSGIQMQAPQQVPTVLSTQNRQALSRALMNNRFSSSSDLSLINRMRLLKTTSQPAEIEMINLQEIPPSSSSMSPLDILNDALAKMEDKAASKNSMPLARFKRKSSRRHLSLLKPFS